eukprot:jgi/Psemu1/40379/gm1.40379_g
MSSTAALQIEPDSNGNITIAIKLIIMGAASNATLVIVATKENQSPHSENLLDSDESYDVEKEKKDLAVSNKGNKDKRGNNGDKGNENDNRNDDAKDIPLEGFKS